MRLRPELRVPMRLYNTEHGPAREAEPGILTVVDLPDLGDVVRDGGLDRIESAPCVDEVPLADARLLAPVPRPGKVIIVGLNYPRDGHARYTASHPAEFLYRRGVSGHRSGVANPSASGCSGTGRL